MICRKIKIKSHNRATVLCSQGSQSSVQVRTTYDLCKYSPSGFVIKLKTQILNVGEK